MNKNDQLRSKTLREINTWCYERASHLSITAKKKKENKRKSNNHSAIDQIAQAEAIKFATNQSGSRKITREMPKAHEQK